MDIFAKNQLGMTKVQLFNNELQVTAALFKALGSPARLAILQHLAKINVCISGDITNELPLSRTTVNQHLKILKKAGFIKGSISGTKVNYCLDSEKIKIFNPLLTSFLAGLESCNECNC